MNQQQEYNLKEKIVMAYINCDFAKAQELERLYFSNPLQRRIDSLPQPSRPYVSEGAISDLEDFEEDEMWGWEK